MRIVWFYLLLGSLVTNFDCQKDAGTTTATQEGNPASSKETLPARVSPEKTTKDTLCPLEENCQCPVAGVTSRWQLAFCAWKIETDDVESEKAMKCLDAETKRADIEKMSGCEKNAYYKREICTMRVEAEKNVSLEACIQDTKYLPYPVEGIGE